MRTLDKFDTQEKIMDLVKECAEFYQQGEITLEEYKKIKEHLE